jgi:hypothetical protein
LFPADTRGLKLIDMEVCYWALLFMPLVILHHLLNVFVQLANKRGFKQKKICGKQYFVTVVTVNYILIVVTI